MRFFCFLAAGALSSFLPQAAERADDKAPLAIPTFHCLGLYWSPPGGSPERPVEVRYRAKGEAPWKEALPMRYNPIPGTDEDLADYRGSIVNLQPGTRYEVDLHLHGMGVRATLEAATWSERFPVASVVRCESRGDTLNVGKSGTPGGYLLYDGAGTVIDAGNASDVGIAVNASHVILRGFTIRNVRQHGIRILGGHHIVIEDCDISRWGSEDEKGFGVNYQAGVFSNNKDIHAVVIQRCRMHHPAWDTNSWAEDHRGDRHPAGPQTVVFWNSAGNHVIRHNEFWSDEDHYFNDVLGAGSNSGYRGFPGADSDIYGNYVAHCWDDGIEAEGGNRNVRVWNNYIENMLIPVANACTVIGPLYVWRNVSGRSYSPPGSSWNMTHGPFLKMGYANGEQWMTGHMYVFNNTVFQPGGEGAGGLGGSRIVKHAVSRNNIFHVRSDDGHSASANPKNVDNDFDYDLFNGRVPPGQEAHGVRGRPVYAAGSGFDPATRTGRFQLAPGSPGAGSGVAIPNFSEGFAGTAPDMGAHPRGQPPLRFGVGAR